MAHPPYWLKGNTYTCCVPKTASLTLCFDKFFRTPKEIASVWQLLLWHLFCSDSCLATQQADVRQKTALNFFLSSAAIKSTPGMHPAFIGKSLGLATSPLPRWTISM